MSTHSKKVMTVEDVDEAGNAIQGSERYADSVASPTKEKPNTSRARRERSGRSSGSPAISGLTDSDSTVHPTAAGRRESRDSRSRSSRETRENKDSSASSRRHSSNKQDLVTLRPSAKHSKTAPMLNYGTKGVEDPSYYGVPTTVTPSSSSRPRAHTSHPRPSSYYGTASRPPPSNARFYSHTTAPLPTSYPPQTWTNAGAPVHPTLVPAVSYQPDYFTSRPQDLIARFDRPQSAMGHRPSYSNDYDEQRPSRRSSVSRKTRAEDDKRAMPPPQRPASARPTLSFRPPSTPSKRIVAFNEDDLDGESILFKDISPLAPFQYSPPAIIPQMQRLSIGSNPGHYDLAYRIDGPVSGGSRRNSYFGEASASSGSAYEDKVRHATVYQNDVGGGPTLPLTAESLRKASKTSSRSTRSSASRDESDYRQSATTRTTRSSGNDEDVTIRVKGNAVFKVGGAEMQCRDGAEINITRNAGPGLRGSSDKSSYADSEDHRSRRDRPACRTRASSQSNSYSRTVPRYELSHYQHAVMPPYPAYPIPHAGGFI